MSNNALPALSATTLLVTVLGLFPRRSLSAKRLVAIGALFAHSERAIRVALARLTQDGRIVLRERGVYAVGSEGRVIRDELSAWTHVERRVMPWDGSWLAVHTANVQRIDRKRLRRHETALRLRGFRSLDASLWFRPGNLDGGLVVVKSALLKLGLDDRAIVLHVQELDRSLTGSVPALWDVRQMKAQYLASREMIRESARRIPRLELEAGVVETLLVGRHVVRQILLDPLLPEEMIGNAHREALIAEMTAYDALGKGLWATYFE
jgi:phenylacetic acid degradation operon negative regulatory protein